VAPGAVSTAEWEGVPLAAVLGEAEIGADAAEVVFTGADGFVRSLPIDDACQARKASTALQTSSPQ